ncbi:MAG TPA: hypothetical protein V6D16_13100, partial [Candidatus Obscuribacterales bacterium]
MHPETEQLLGTLQVLTEPGIQFRFPSNHRSSFVPFVWDSHEKGELNILSLSYAEGWIQLTDIDVALSSWQAVENRGSLDPDFDPEFLEYDDTNHAVDEVTKVTRAKKYLALSQLLQSELQELEIFKLSCCPIYSFCVVIGRTKNDDWICISPTVAQETKIGEELSCSPLPETNVTRQLGEDSLNLESKIEEIIAEIEPIIIYGFYAGGYDYRFDYRLISAVANTKSQAFEEALR